MDVKSSKNRKKSKKKTKQTAQVEAKPQQLWVLPPKLLQKLGLNLASLKPTESSANETVKNELTAEQCTLNSMTNNDPAEASSSAADSGVTKESSILQTACLMKEAVFLSPTFSSNLTSDSGEVQITTPDDNNDVRHNTNIINDDAAMKSINISNNLMEKATNSLVHLSDNHIKSHDTQYINSMSTTDETDNHIKSDETQYINSLSTTDEQQFNYKLHQNPDKCATVAENGVVLPDEILEDHLDEAYSSDCSSSNCDPIKHSNTVIDSTSFSISSIVEVEPNNKINIISEQILSPSQLSELKCFHGNLSSKHSLKPMPLNTWISLNNTEKLNTNTRQVFEKDDSDKVAYSSKGDVINSLDCINHFNEQEDNDIEAADKVENADNSFDACIDFNVSDIERHLEENEEILENFANEITSNDTNKIIEKIKNTENVCQEKQPQTHFETYFESPLEIHFNNLSNNRDCETATNIIASDKNTKYNESVIEKNKSTEHVCQEKQLQMQFESPLEIHIDNLSNHRDCETAINIIASDTNTKNNENVLEKTKNIEIVCQEKQLKMQFDTNFESPLESHIDRDCETATNVNASNTNTKNNETVFRDRNHDRSVLQSPHNPVIQVNKNISDDNTHSSASTSVKYYAIKKSLNKEFSYLKLKRYKTYSHKKNDNDLTASKSEKYEIAEFENDIRVNPNTKNSPHAPFNILESNDKINNASSKKVTTSLTCEKVTETEKSSNPKNNDQNDQHCSKTDSEEVTDKIKEIASYLCEFALGRSLAIKPLTANKELVIKNQTNNIIKSKTIHSQGVEKPGGSDVINYENNYGKKDTKISSTRHMKQIDGSEPCTNVHKSSIKTYLKSRKAKQISHNVVPMVQHNPNFDLVNNIGDLSNDLQETAGGDCITTLNKTHTFCLCKDFGSLTCYDDKKLCEHIHFLDHKKINCGYRLLLSIYDDKDSQVCESNFETDPDEENLSSLDFGICWNILLKDDAAETTIPASIESACLRADKSDVLSDHLNPNHEIKQEKSCGKNYDTNTQGKIHSLNTENNDSLAELKAETSEPINKYDNQPKEKTTLLLSQDEFNNKIDVFTEKESCVEDDLINLDIDHGAVSKHIVDEELPDNNLENQYKNCEIYTSEKREDSQSNAFDLNDEMECDSFTPDDPNNYCSVLAKECHSPLKQIIETGVFIPLGNIESNIDAALSGMKDYTDIVVTSADQIMHEYSTAILRSDTAATDSKLVVSMNEAANYEENKLKTEENLANHEEKQLKTNEKRKSGRPKKRKISTTLPNEQRESDSPKASCDTEEATPSRKRRKTQDITCGVCSSSVSKSMWLEHIAMKHAYLAWKEGEKPVDKNNTPAIKEHLNTILTQVDTLTCHKCGFSCRKGHYYLNHTKKCVSSMDAEPSKDGTVEDNIISDQNRSSSLAASVKCSVCKQEIDTNSWFDHIRKEHNYLAWKEGQEPLNEQDEKDVHDHLYRISKEAGGLECPKCGVLRKYVKGYLQHVKSCSASETAMNTTLPLETTMDTTLPSETKMVTTLTSGTEMDTTLRVPSKTKVDTITLASESTMDTTLPSESKMVTTLPSETEMDTTLASEATVDTDLDNISLKALKERSSIEDANKMKTLKEESSKEDNKKMLVCGVCKQELKSENWLDHIQMNHDYIAWKEEDKPIDKANTPAIKEHLNTILTQVSSLTCHKCGFSCRKAHYYLNHAKKCVSSMDAEPSTDGTVIKRIHAKCLKKTRSGSSQLEKDTSISSTLMDSNLENSIISDQNQSSSLAATVKCSVCKQKIDTNSWFDHIRKEHHYLAWKEGQKPLNVQDENDVHDHLYRLSKEAGGLECPKCGVLRKYVKGYLQHVKSCSASETTMDTTLPSETKMLTTLTSETEMDTTLRLPSETKIDTTLASESIMDTTIPSETTMDTTLPSETKMDTTLPSETTMDITSASEATMDTDLDNISLKALKERSSIEDANKMKTLKEESSKEDDKKMLVCGVCKQELKSENWLDHIQMNHDYIAWKEGDKPINLEDPVDVYKHLQKILKDNRGLVCSKCGVKRKYVKPFMEHVQTCTGAAVSDKDTTLPSEAAETTINSELDTSSHIDLQVGGSAENVRKVLVCGVCKKDIKPGNWLEHIQKRHGYIAWEEGREPINTEDADAVSKHLYTILKDVGELVCSNCNLKRKYLKTYLQHIKSCTTSVFSTPGTGCQCGVCSEMVPAKKWTEHRMKKHYNIAWIEGDTPIDMNNPNVAEKLIKEYRNTCRDYKMVCKTCGISRASCVGFYAHILTCGKPDEETEQFKNLCDVCNKYYLKIYHNQHMNGHRESILHRERKLIEAQMKAEAEEERKKEKIEEEVEAGTPRRRKAALKARTVIENYKTELGTDSKQALAKKEPTPIDPFSDSDESAKIGSGDDSSDSDASSGVASEEEQVFVRRKRSKPPPSALTYHLPINDKKAASFIEKSCKEFCEFHFTDENLFPELNNLHGAPVPESELQKYMPPLEESCKVRFDKDWVTYSRFEAKPIDKSPGYSFFTGGSIQSIAWAPATQVNSDDQYLAISCHNDGDCPRLEADEITSGPGLIQIWSFEDFKSTPKFVYGLAHDYGTVWAIDWCPSGAQTSSRLGLLAAACSNGSAYVLSVPHPRMIDDNQTASKFFKLEPVVELRFSMVSKNKYHASTLKWSPQKGHAVIIVGYSDGTTAHYDLTNESPLLKTRENNTTVLYPYFDERTLNACVMDVATFPSSWSSSICGAVAAGGLTGSDMAASTATGATRVRCKLPASRVHFLPLWPTLAFSSDEGFVIMNGQYEIAWWGVGRRVPCSIALAGCVRCARVAYSATPLIRVALLHPAHRETKKGTIGSIQMVPLSNKRKKAAKDDLAVKLEPITYSAAVEKYGLEFKRDSSLQVKAQKEIYPQRFPLAEVRSMAFCPSAEYHHKLAVATHAGIVFLLSV